MSSFTPGPWQIVGKYKGEDGSFYLSTMHPSPIFELQPVVGSEDQHIANARLIAAAPELLEALEGMIKWYAKRDLDDEIAAMPFQQEEVRRALIAVSKAKAEGRSNG